MDLAGLTSTTLATSPQEAYLQLREPADRAALVNLSITYSQAVDDLDTVVDCFAPDGSFTRLGAQVSGHADLRPFYTSMMDRYVTTLHTPETHPAQVDVRAGTATGTVNGHGELGMFASRSIGFMYNVPFEQMPTSFADTRRLRVPDSPVADGDYPETLPTWSGYR